MMMAIMTMMMMIMMILMVIMMMMPVLYIRVQSINIQHNTIVYGICRGMSVSYL